jgi:hypothetical protein
VISQERRALTRNFMGCGRFKTSPSHASNSRNSERVPDDVERLFDCREDQRE